MSGICAAGKPATGRWVGTGPRANGRACQRRREGKTGRRLCWWLALGNVRLAGRAIREDCNTIECAWAFLASGEPWPRQTLAGAGRGAGVAACRAGQGGSGSGRLGRTGTFIARLNLSHCVRSAAAAARPRDAPDATLPPAVSTLPTLPTRTTLPTQRVPPVLSCPRHLAHRAVRRPRRRPGDRMTTICRAVPYIVRWTTRACVSRLFSSPTYSRAYFAR